LRRCHRRCRVCRSGSSVSLLLRRHVVWRGVSCPTVGAKLLVESASGMDEHYNSEEKCAPIEENSSETETRLRTVKHNSLCIQCLPSMYRGRVFIGDGSPTTLRYYTVIPPNNYIPGNSRGTTVFLHHLVDYIQASFCPLGPLQPIGPRFAHHRSANMIPSRLLKCSLSYAFLCWSSILQTAHRPSPRFACLRLRLWRLGLRPSSLALVFAFGALVFASLAEPAEDLVVAFKLCASLRSMAEGGAPTSSPSESSPILGGMMTSTSSPEAPPFGPRPIVSRTVEA